MEVRRRPPDLLLRLCGDLDVLTASFVQLPGPVTFDGIDSLCVDLTDVGFCDLAGLRRLAHLYADFSSAGFTVHIVGAGPSLVRASWVTGVARRLCEPAPAKGAARPRLAAG